MGDHYAAEAPFIPQLIDELFLRPPEIPDPLLRGIWLHHELVRTHPLPKLFSKMSYVGSKQAPISFSLACHAKPKAISVSRIETFARIDVSDNLPVAVKISDSCLP